MHARFPLLTSLILLFPGCGKKEQEPATPEAERKAPPVHRPYRASIPSEASSSPTGKQKITSTVEKLHSLPDEQLALAVEALLEADAEANRDSLLSSIYEETDLRPAFIRLPILLELARQDTGQSGLRTTILAELRTTLQEDHGHSWPDWALALAEHLSNLEGFLPTGGSPDDQ